MPPPLPVAPTAHTRAHYGSTVSVPPRPDLQRLADAPVLGRLLAGRLVAGPRVEDGLRVAAGLVAAGSAVALEHRPGTGDDAAVELSALAAGVRAAGPPGNVELTLPVDLVADARELAGLAAAAGLGVALEGPADRVDALLPDLPEVRVVVPAGETGAEARCRALAGARVRLRAGRRRAARLAFVRCLDVLMTGDGEPAVATSDPRLIAITGERAAWHGRPSDSWEHVMPWGIRTAEQQRLAAAGSRVRIAVPSGRGAVAALAGHAGGSR
jgi:proline dehydrogenase